VGDEPAAAAGLVGRGAIRRPVHLEERHRAGRPRHAAATRVRRGARNLGEAGDPLGLLT
jgi:hypothetical protein